MFIKTKKEYDNVNDEYKGKIKNKLTRHLEIGNFGIERGGF